jgi:hypothetical protein
MDVQHRNSAIFYTLRNIPKGPNENWAGNPRRILFYEGMAAAITGSGRAFAGFFDPGLGGSPHGDWCLYDPWGQQYGIILDTNGDERIDLGAIYPDFAGVDSNRGKAPRKRVGAFSMGKDRMLGTNGNRVYRRDAEVSDDVISWE